MAAVGLKSGSWPSLDRPFPIPEGAWPLHDDHEQPASFAGLVDHFFRHESARLVAALIRRFGVRHLPLAEDAVQVALARALISWRQRGVPEQPTAWLMRVASNHAIDQLRRDARKHAKEPEVLELACPDEIDKASIDQTLEDSLLRMIFVCCDPLVPAESQTALALKTLCGFSIGETARALVSTQESIAKRITRAKERLRDSNLQLDELRDADICERLPNALRVIYLLFNEGYSSTQAEKLIREDLCEEAVRLALLLAEHPLTKCSMTAAFMALLLFHAARLDARVDGDGVIMLFHQQRAEDWDLRLMREAFAWFAKSAESGEVSRYHAEAMIAAEHCRGKLNGETQWQYIVGAYDLLCHLAPSPIHELNRAIAIAHQDGAPAGLEALTKIDSSQLAQNYYLWHATAGELHSLANNREAAEQALRRAWSLAPTSAEKELICRKIDKLSN